MNLIELNRKLSTMFPKVPSYRLETTVRHKRKLQFKLIYIYIDSLHNLELFRFGSVSATIASRVRCIMDTPLQ